MPRPWARGWPARPGRGKTLILGGSGDPVLSLVLAALPASQLGACTVPAAFTGTSWAKTCPRPLPYVSGLCHILHGGSHGRWGGGGG